LDSIGFIDTRSDLSILIVIISYEKLKVQMQRPSVNWYRSVSQSIQNPLLDSWLTVPKQSVELETFCLNKVNLHVMPSAVS